MDAPKKLYLIQDNGLVCYCRSNKDDIDYIRKDAFLNKACEWLRNNSHNYAHNALGKEYLVNDFKKYMEE